VKGKLTCHIRRAWPEFGKVKALCGADPEVGSWGGMATSDCANCLTRALHAGMWHDLDITVVRSVFRRMKRLGVDFK
jgi:hypothetical protein